MRHTQERARLAPPAQSLTIYDLVEEIHRMVQQMNRDSSRGFLGLGTIPSTPAAHESDATGVP